MNTLILDQYKRPEKFHEIPDRYTLQEVTWDDRDDLVAFYNIKGIDVFRKKVPKRLDSERCHGFAFRDNTSGGIAYCNWIIFQYENYLREFGIKPAEKFVFWDSSVCLPEHRHQGLHIRMEQELIEYSIKEGARNFYMQIHKSNIKGNNYAVSKGYRLLNDQLVISWPVFNVYRNFRAFLRNPFRKIII